MDAATGGNLPEYRLSEVEIGQSSPLAGTTIRGTRLRENTGATILSIRKSGRQAHDATPAPETPVEAGDTLVLIGTPLQMAETEALLEGR